MTSTVFNIYLCGVGGQGIGLLSEVLLRAADHAGHVAKGVDTHGLAQRGGMVVSQIRLGAAAFSPLIPGGKADLVVALERHEALRAVQTALRDHGVLAYCNAVIQPLGVRLGTEAEVTDTDIEEACGPRGIAVHRVTAIELADARMQNMVVLALLHRLGLVPGVATEHYLQAMDDLLSGTMLEENLRLFKDAA